jgi:class 3 adenylate cyclase
LPDCWEISTALSRENMIATNILPKEKSNRIILFADLRDSTNILLNFEKGLYLKNGKNSNSDSSYEEFIHDVHEKTYKKLYLLHENTFAEVYGDGILAVFPEDNAKYVLENIYQLTNGMRHYNDSIKGDNSSPKINMGCGITMGNVTFVHYLFDNKDHPIGQGIHEAARIEGISRRYDARILISQSFYNFIQDYIKTDPRFSFRFIDKVVLKGFNEPVTLYELLLDNDPRFEIKKKSVSAYNQAYDLYSVCEWEKAREIFLSIYREYGLCIGSVMANRCKLLAVSKPECDWKGVWNLTIK